MSREILQDTDGARYWEISVQCASTRDSRIIERQDKSSKWCLQEAPSNCFSQKINAARKACSGRYKDLIAAEGGTQEKQEAKPEVAKVESKQAAPVAAKPAAVTPGVDKNALLSEKIAIEKELIQIKQKKVELRQRELELKKLELEIQNGS